MSWYQQDREHAWHPYTQMLTAPPPIPIASARDATLYTTDGRALIDAISSWWVLLHGHSNERIAEAIGRQARCLDQVIYAGFTHEPAGRLVKEITDLTPGDLDRVFFSDNGSTSVEVALKMALQFWRNVGEDNRQTFLSLEGAYHGDTVGAMSVSGVELFGSHFKPLLFDVLRAENLLCPEKPEFVPGVEATRVCLASMEKLMQEHRGKVAAVIIEPMVQGAGGMMIWPAEFLRGVRELCDRHDVLLIADEVFTGFGRTGKLFACDHGPIVPDILCLSKALTGGVLPLAATVTHDRVYNAFLSEDREKTLFHGHSFTANPIACAAALESLAILRETGLDRVAEVERFQRERAARVQEMPRVIHAAALGLIARIEIGGSDPGYLDDLGPELSSAFLAKEIVLRPLGNVLYTVPPLCITDDELTRIWDAIDEVLAEFLK